MILPIFASFIVFILILNRAIQRNNKKQRSRENEFWERERSVNLVRKQSLDTLNYITFSPASILPETLLDPSEAAELLQEEKLPPILERLQALGDERIVNLNYITNTDLKATYGVANLTTLMAYDQNFTDLITLLQEYAALLHQHNHPRAALKVLQIALDAGSDIGASFLLAADCCLMSDNRDALSGLIQQAKQLESPRRNTIVRNLSKYSPNNG